MKNTLAIEARHLQKSYNNIPVLRDVSFRVRQGTIFALLGENGAGKTTTINILTTLIQADGGTAKIAGYHVEKEAAEVRKSISLTGQNVAVDDILTGRENLQLIGELRHVNKPGRTAEMLLRRFGLNDAADRRTATYSGGMQKRLDIAMSLIGDPAIIFLDEPTTGLDPQSRMMMWDLIKTLSESGRTIFLTTQYLEEAAQLADSIAILHEGIIAAQGTPEDLKKLLPQEKIEFTFHNRSQIDAAVKLFGQHHLIRNDEKQTLSVATDGSVTQIARLFTTLDDAHIEVVKFTQRSPRLEEAFFQVINNGKKEQS